MSDAGFVEVARGALVIAAKDLKTEFRSKEILLTMGFFGFLVVLIFAFAFFRGDAPIAAVAAGILWVAIAFSGSLGLSRVFDRERDGDCIRALLLSPVPRTAIYLGKVLGIFVFMTIVELVVTPAVAFFFNLTLDAERIGLLAAVIVMGTIGYAVVGALLAASLIRAQSKDVLLAIVLYPIVVPVIIAGVKATSAILEPTIATDAVALWLKVLLVFDTVFLIASLWTFEALILD